MSVGRAELHADLDRLLDAIAAERDAGLGVEDRRAKQQEVLGHLHNLQQRSGLHDLLQRRLVAEMRGASHGAAVTSATLPTTVADYSDEAGLRRLRAIVRRAILDCGYMPAAAAGLLAGDMLFAVEGYKLTGAFGALSERVPRSGRNPAKGADHAVRLLVVTMLGYTAGYEGSPVSRRLTGDIFTRLYRMLRKRLPDGVQPPERAAIRQWCTTAEKETFEAAYQQGKADHAAGREPQQDTFLPA